MDYGFVKQLIWLLTKRYPERLGKCLIVNAPYIFMGCWLVIKLWWVYIIPTCIYMALSFIFLLFETVIATKGFKVQCKDVDNGFFIASSERSRKIF